MGDFQTKKKALKLTNIRISIPNATTTKRRPGVSAFTTYLIEVELGGSQWQVRRRYSDFYYVHNLMKKYVKTKELPKMPPKKYVGSSTSSAFVEERRVLLEKYLRKVIQAPSCWLRSDIVQFLDNPQNVLMFTWNFERMQKMQEMLGSMTVENQSQTEMLTNELDNARAEVSILKERIAQMEMLFLQQATGAAANKLDTKVLSTLNSSSNPRLRLLNEEVEVDVDDEVGEEGIGSHSTQEDSGSGKTYAQALQDKSETDLKNASVSYDEEELEEEDSQHCANECPEISLKDVKKPVVSVQPQEVIEILKLAKEEDNSDNLSRSSHSQPSVDNSYMLDYDVKDSVELQQRMVMMSRSLQHAVKLSNELLEEKFRYATDASGGSLLRMPNETIGERISGLHGEKIEASSLEPESCHGILSELLTFDDEQQLLCVDVPPISEGREDSVGSSDSATRDLDVAFTFGDVGPDYVSSKCQTGWSKRLAGRFDEVLTVFIPTEESIAERMNIAHFVKSMISTSIGGQLFPIGSFCSKTYLPKGGVDLCSFLTNAQAEGWFVRVNEALCISSMDDNKAAKENKVNVRNVSFINSEVKFVKSIMNNVEVDVSVNQISALYAQALLDKIDNFIGEKHLFKRSCILIRMWCEFESPRHTSSGVGSICDTTKGRVSTWAIMVMTIWVFNKYGKDIRTTLQALCGFLSYFSGFDWNKYAITVHGPVLVEDLSEAKDLSSFYALPKCGGFIPGNILDSMHARFLKVLEAMCKVENKDECFSKGTLDTGGNESERGVIPFSESQCEFKSIMGVPVYGHYRRGIVNVMDPIQQKKNLTHSLDTVGANALFDALRGGKSSFIKLCLDSQKEMFDAKDKLSVLQVDSPDADPDIMTLLSVRDIPILRSFLEGSTRVISEISRGNGQARVSFPTVMELEDCGYATLKSNQCELELAMKHAELILGNMVTPEALARLIVYALEVKGPLPVGEVGKLLQEATGNENLAAALKTAFKGLKKVLEGFQGIFHIGSDHPFNPLVSLTDEYIEKRDNNVLDDSAVANMYVFEPGPPPEPRVNSSDNDSTGDNHFLPLNKKGKSSSFKGESRRDSGNIRENHSRSNSLGSSISVDTTGSGTSRKPPSSRSPKKFNKVDQHGGIRLSAQEYQQYQQYQMHMMREQQRYQLYLQQQQQQSGQPSGSSHHVHEGSVLGSDQMNPSHSIPPPIPIPSHSPSFSGAYMPHFSPTQQQMYQIPPSHGSSFSPQNSPGTSPMRGGYYYDQSGNVYYPTDSMGGMPHHPVPNSSPVHQGVAMRHPSQESGDVKPKSPKRNNSSQN